MGWSVALACASVGEPERVFRPGITADARTATDLAHRLYRGHRVVEFGDTVLDFALWPYEDEAFVGAYGDAIVVCDRRFYRPDDDARRLTDTIAAELPRARCGVLVLHNLVSSCLFRWYEGGRLRRDLFVTAADGIVFDEGSPLSAERPFWGAGDAHEEPPLAFDPGEFGWALATAHLFGRDPLVRGADGFLPLELPLRRFKLR